MKVRMLNSWILFHHEKDAIKNAKEFFKEEYPKGKLKVIILRQEKRLLFGCKETTLYTAEAIGKIKKSNLKGENDRKLFKKGSSSRDKDRVRTIRENY